MEFGAQQLLIGLMGGGLVALIPVIVNAIKDISKGRIVKEDTAINRWKAIADNAEKNSQELEVVSSAFRKWYPLLWTRYVRATGDEDTFPSDPVRYESKRKESDD